jgi:hypothetical protein
MTDKAWHGAPYHFDAPATYLMTFALVLAACYWLGSGLRKPVTDLIFSVATASSAGLQVFAMQKLVGLEDVAIIFRIMVFAAIVLWVLIAISAYRAWKPDEAGANWIANLVPELWSIKFAVFIAQFAAFAIYLLLFGLALMLELVGVEQLRRVLLLDPVEASLAGFSFALGILVAQEKREILRPVRHVFAWLFRILYPVQALGLTIFLVVAVSDGFRKLLENDFSIWWIVTGSAVGLLYLLFGASQLENPEREIYGGKTELVFRASLFLAPALTAIAIYALLQPVITYGLTPSRVYGLWTTAIVMAASVMLLLTVCLNRRKGDPVVRDIFGRILICVGVGAFFVHLPLMDPVSMSARSISENIRDAEEINNKDLEFIAQELGHRGTDILSARGFSEDEIAELRDKKSRWEEEEELAEKFKTFDGITLYPTGYRAESETRKAVLQDYNFDADRCAKERDCAILMTDLNADGIDEAVFFGGPAAVTMFEFDTGEKQWVRSKSSGMTWLHRNIDYEQLLKGLAAGDVETSPPLNLDLVIGGQRVGMNGY